MVVKGLEDGHYELFCKGAPEMVVSLSLPETGGWRRMRGGYWCSFPYIYLFIHSFVERVTVNGNIYMLWILSFEDFAQSSNLHIQLIRKLLTRLQGSALNLFVGPFILFRIDCLYGLLVSTFLLLAYYLLMIMRKKYRIKSIEGIFYSILEYSLTTFNPIF